MKNSLNFITIALLAISFWLYTFAGVPDEINVALGKGNTETLKQYFNQTIELVLLDKENVYSNVQAEQILKQFFTTNSPKSFEILHHGGNENSQYYIGTLKTERKSFRIYYLLKNKSGQNLLYQLRIEDDE
ncbi:MAG: DUF4783 domain-containing protein [Bacteroidales bacterium]|nr:DUF4783 domain-containing protein [Bacteroidales bacterium]